MKIALCETLDSPMISAVYVRIFSSGGHILKSEPKIRLRAIL